MGFYYAEAKSRQPKAVASTKPRLKDIPVEAMAEMGCKVCPRDNDRGKATKLSPSGYVDMVHVYVLFSAPSAVDGFPRPDQRAEDVAMRTVLEKFPAKHSLNIRIGGVVQCATGTAVVNQAEAACCRNRVVADIERAEPLIILGVGDGPLAWATGLDAYAPKFRGTLIRTKIGKHVCYYYPVNYPNWAFKEKGKKQYGKSEHELTLEHDIANLFQMLEDSSSWDTYESATSQHYSTKLDSGIEVITGGAAGDMQRLERALADMASEARVGLDIETPGLRPYATPKGLDIVCAAVGTFERTVAFSMDHPDGWGSDVQKRRVWSLFGEWLIHSGIKECHNLGFEQEWLGHFYGGRMLRLTEWDDTMSMCHTLDEREGTKSLDVQTRINFGFFLKSLSLVDVSRKNWWLLYPLKDILRYNGLDSKWTNRLSRTLRPRLALDPKMVYQHNRKVHLASTLVLTELKGLPVDLGFAEKLAEELEAKSKQIEKKVLATPEVRRYETRFGTFSPTNPDHVLQLLDKVCSRDEIRRTDRDGKVKLTTDEEALSSIPRGEVPSVHLILEHRGVEKLLSTYVRPVVTRRIVFPDGKIHAKYSSMRAVTGRLAGEDPNPQNWPKRKHKAIRGIVAVEKGRWIAAYDYGQIEFRVVGMASGDDNLVKYCWTSYDVHRYWAERVLKKYPLIKDWVVSEFEVDWDEKGIKTLRQEAKNKWVFPMLFGSSARSCAINLNLPLEVADDMATEFWDEFPGVKRWQKQLLKFYEKHLYVETLGGNRRRGPMTLNEIINMPIQGTAAEIVCEGMCAVSERALVEENDDLQPMLNVHDDLSFNPLDSRFEYINAVIVEEMCKHRFDYINVPLVVEASIGPRWSELEEIGVYRSDVLFNLPNPYK